MTNYDLKAKYKKLQKAAKFFFYSTIVLLIITIVLSATLAKTISIKSKKPILIGSVELKQIGENVFEIVEDTSKSSIKISASSNAEDNKLPSLSEIPELPQELFR